jgi:hypothetical protein
LLDLDGRLNEINRQGYGHASSPAYAAILLLDDAGGI